MVCRSKFLKQFEKCFTIRQNGAGKILCILWPTFVFGRAFAKISANDQDKISPAIRASLLSTAAIAVGNVVQQAVEGVKNFGPESRERQVMNSGMFDSENLPKRQLVRWVGGLLDVDNGAIDGASEKLMVGNGRRGI